MDVFETISAQVTATRLPIYAVTAATVPRRDTPIILIIHWHGFARETPLRLPGIPVPLRSVAGSALQIEARGEGIEEIEQSLLDAAWQLGAWDLERQVGRPWWRLGAPASEALAGHRAFGDYPDADDGEPGVVMEAPDRDELMRMAAHKGYVRWLFRPRKGGLWGEVADEDSTLDSAGGRALPCPFAPYPLETARAGRAVYRLGKVDRIIF
ncbi:MAG: diguanylate cyclase [Pigmentiphaga sp.]|uniref:diguanylate cyclase n=1 Tax=Pigmentiphaga sp. TaxID=1977564 RepID=UPI0029A3ED44|nr:diguanylate cyclase [Pigmentiphaga sp.]MDX3905240.1 diguanylate cyclase [Pigmentiphaga sp.]